MGEELIIIGQKLFGNKPAHIVELAEKIASRGLEPVGMRGYDWEEQKTYQECLICEKEVDNLEEHLKKHHGIPAVVWLCGRCYDARQLK